VRERALNSELSRKISTSSGTEVGLTRVITTEGKDTRGTFTGFRDTRMRGNIPDVVDVFERRDSGSRETLCETGSPGDGFTLLIARDKAAAASRTPFTKARTAPTTRDTSSTLEGHGSVMVLGYVGFGTLGTV